MKTWPSSLLLPRVTAALVHGCASTSLLLHPCELRLATGNELIQLKFPSPCQHAEMKTETAASVLLNTPGV